MLSGNSDDTPPSDISLSLPPLLTLPNLPAPSSPLPPSLDSSCSSISLPPLTCSDSLLSLNLKEATATEGGENVLLGEDVGDALLRGLGSLDAPALSAAADEAGGALDVIPSPALAAAVGGGASDVIPSPALIAAAGGGAGDGALDVIPADTEGLIRSTNAGKLAGIPMTPTSPPLPSFDSPYTLPPFPLPDPMFSLSSRDEAISRTGKEPLLGEDGESGLLGDLGLQNAPALAAGGGSGGGAALDVVAPAAGSTIGPIGSISVDKGLSRAPFFPLPPSLDFSKPTAPLPSLPFPDLMLSFNSREAAASRAGEGALLGEDEGDGLLEDLDSLNTPTLVAAAGGTAGGTAGADSGALHVAPAAGSTTRLRGSTRADKITYLPREYLIINRRRAGASLVRGTRGGGFSVGVALPPAAASTDQQLIINGTAGGAPRVSGVAEEVSGSARGGLSAVSALGVEAAADDVTEPLIRAAGKASRGRGESKEVRTEEAEAETEVKRSNAKRKTAALINDACILEEDEVIGKRTVPLAEPVVRGSAAAASDTGSSSSSSSSSSTSVSSPLSALAGGPGGVEVAGIASSGYTYKRKKGGSRLIPRLNIPLLLEEQCSMWQDFARECVRRLMSCELTKLQRRAINNMRDANISRMYILIDTCMPTYEEIHGSRIQSKEEITHRVKIMNFIFLYFLHNQITKKQAKKEWGPALKKQARVIQKTIIKKLEHKDFESSSMREAFEATKHLIDKRVNIKIQTKTGEWIDADSIAGMPIAGVALRAAARTDPHLIIDGTADAPITSGVVEEVSGSARGRLSAGSALGIAAAAGDVPEPLIGSTVKASREGGESKEARSEEVEAEVVEVEAEVKKSNAKRKIPAEVNDASILEKDEVITEGTVPLAEAVVRSPAIAASDLGPGSSSRSLASSSSAVSSKTTAIENEDTCSKKTAKRKTFPYFIDLTGEAEGAGEPVFKKTRSREIDIKPEVKTEIKPIQFVDLTAGSKRITLDGFYTSVNKRLSEMEKNDLEDFLEWYIGRLKANNCVVTLDRRLLDSGKYVFQYLFPDYSPKDKQYIKEIALFYLFYRFFQQIMMEKMKIFEETIIEKLTPYVDPDDDQTFQLEMAISHIQPKLELALAVSTSGSPSDLTAGMHSEPSLRSEMHSSSEAVGSLSSSSSQIFTTTSSSSSSQVFTAVSSSSGSQVATAASAASVSSRVATPVDAASVGSRVTTAVDAASASSSPVATAVGLASTSSSLYQVPTAAGVASASSSQVATAAYLDRDLSHSSVPSATAASARTVPSLARSTGISVAASIAFASDPSKQFSKLQIEKNRIADPSAFCPAAVYTASAISTLWHLSGLALKPSASGSVQEASSSSLSAATTAGAGGARGLTAEGTTLAARLGIFGGATASPAAAAAAQPSKVHSPDFYELAG